MVPINTTNVTTQHTRLINALGAEDSSVRLKAALAVGSDPDPVFLEPLVEQCAVDPDFYVRDMLSWALTRLSPEITLPRIRKELDSERNQARSQALHTLSKISDKSTWAWITRDMLRDADDEVARTAWRVAVVLVPEDEEKDLADELVLQLGRGSRSVQLSLSRAFVDLGDVIKPALEKAAEDPDPAVAAHARATELLRQNPETGFDAAIEEAKRMVGSARSELPRPRQLRRVPRPRRLAPKLGETAEPAATTEPTEQPPDPGRRGLGDRRLLIGDVARHSGVSTRMLRHYDALGLVQPTGRTVSGYREYSAEDVRKIFHVESLRSLGLSLKQIGRALEDPAFTPSALVSDLIRRTEDRLAREHELLERLRVIDASAPTGWQDVLRVVELMRELNSTSAARRQQAVLTQPEGVSVPAELLVGAVLTESDPHVAGALRWALARAGGEGVAALAAAARSEDVDIRRRAVLAIAEMPEAPGSIAMLADALGDPDATVRGRAALALGR